jgi:hypothetical protein
MGQNPLIFVHVLPALEHHSCIEDDVEGGIIIKKKILEMPLYIVELLDLCTTMCTTFGLVYNGTIFYTGNTTLGCIFK